MESRLLKRNQLKSILCFGKELIVARGPSNKVYVLDAYCPHLGANLAIGGIVERCRIRIGGDKNNNKIVHKQEEDCIRCPFHSWAFRMSDGNCVDVPYEGM